MLKFLSGESYSYVIFNQGDDSIWLSSVCALTGSFQNLRQQQPAPPQLPAVPDDSIKCIEDAKVRDLPPITTHDDILTHKVSHNVCS